LLSLAVASHKHGQLEAAETYARQARQTSLGIGQDLLGKLIWLQGSISRNRGALQQAEEHFRDALDVYRDFSPLNRALLTVELVQTQLLRGKTTEARSTAKAMAALLKPLERNRIAAAAITELVRCAVAGKGLTLALMERAEHHLQKASRGLQVPPGKERIGKD
jgi:ATP/maltotriose-dependent transcriptional regulator MalT